MADERTRRETGEARPLSEREQMAPVPGMAGTPRAMTGGIAAGLIAGLVMALTAMIRSAAVGESFWMPMQQIAATFYGVEALVGGTGVVVAGVLTHLVVSAIYGMIFGLFVGRKTLVGSAFVSGLVYGVVIWAFMTWVILPLVNEVMLERVELQPWWWFAYHLVYGGLLLLTPPLAEAMTPRAERHRREERGPRQAA